jgi:hypothetical protein
MPRSMSPGMRPVLPSHCWRSFVSVRANPVAELTEKWMYIVSSMIPIRARTPKGRRVKAITLQLIREKLNLEPSLFVDLAISLSLDLAAPLRRA